MDIYSHFKQEFQSEMTSIMFARNTIHINAIKTESNSNDGTGSCMPPAYCEATCLPGCGDNYVCALSIMSDCGACPLSTCLSRASLGLPILPTTSSKGTSASTPRNSTISKSKADDSDDLGTIIGSVIGALAAMGVIVAAALFFYFKKSKSKSGQLPFALISATSLHPDPQPIPAPPQTTLSIYTSSKLETDTETPRSPTDALPSSSSSRFMGFPHSAQSTTDSTQARQRQPSSIMYNLALSASLNDTKMTLNSSSRPYLPTAATTAAAISGAEPVIQTRSTSKVYNGSHLDHVPQMSVYSNSVDQISLTTVDTHARQRRSYGPQTQMTHGYLIPRSSPVSTYERQSQTDSLRTESTDDFAKKSNSMVREMIMESYSGDGYNDDDTHHFPAIPFNRPYGT